MVKLLIIIPATESEKKKLLENVSLLQKNLMRISFNSYRILIVYQVNNSYDEEIKSLESNEIKIQFTNIFSLSHARNIGINSLEGENYIHFLDCGIVPCVKFLYLSKKLMESNEPLWRCEIQWNLELANKDTVFKNLDKYFFIKIPVHRTMYHTSVSTYFFKTSLINNIKFNESIGISKNNKLQAGEDTLFCYDVFLKNKIRHYILLKGIYVYHITRPKDYKKELRYSEAQGALHRYLLIREMPFKLKTVTIINFIFFIGNTFYRVVAFKKNSLKIFRNRFIGFFRYKINHNFEKNVS